MKLLILGGTVFLGRHLVEAALARGHELTLFNRGCHGAGLFPELESLRGDRLEGHEALRGRTWDAVVDTSGYVPRVVGDAARVLADAVGHYTFVSTLSVYAEPLPAGADESAALAVLEDESVEEVTGETYGALKALCEQAAEAVLPGRVLQVRSGLIVGPWDPSDRFTWWPRRVARGGEVLAPGGADAPVQFIDGRDLAAWILAMLETNRTGVYNVTGEPLPLGHVLDVSREVSGSDARLTWVDEPFLAAEEVAPWTELPLWLPGELSALNRTSVAKARGAGLAFRPLEDTIRDTLEWESSLPAERQLKAGLGAERERELLRKWSEAVP